MAAKTIKGITVEIGGDTTGLGKALKDVESNCSTLSSSLSKVNKALQLDPSNTELVAEKQKVLASYVDATREKLETLESVQDQVKQQYADGEIGQSAYLDFQKELVYTKSKLEDLEKQQQEFGDTAESVANDELEDLNSTLEETDEAAEEAGDGFTVAKGAISDFISDAVKSAIDKIKDLIGQLFELSEATEEYRTMQAKLAGSADTFGYELEFASGKYQNFYRYLGDEQAATNAITNLMALQTSTQSVSNVADASIAVWTAYGDSIPIESLTESITETAQVAKVTGNLADALNWVGISEDDFNEKLEACNSTQERADLIATTLNDTYAASKAKYDELNASIMDANAAEQALTDTQATLGEAVEPVNTAMTELKNEILVALTPLIVELANAFMVLLEWLKEHPAVVKVLIGVVAALAVAFIALAAAMAIQGIIAMVSSGFAGLSIVMSALPVVVIVAAIAAIVGCLIWLGDNLDAIKALWQETWDSITSWFQAKKDEIASYAADLVNRVHSYFQEMLANVKSTFTELGNNVKNTFNGIVYSAINWGTNLVSGIRNAIENARSAVSSGLERIKSLFNFEWSLPHIKLPHFYISGSFSLNPPSVPSFDVQWYAKGGILNGAQIFGAMGDTLLGGGEAGPEAVLPLSGFYDNLRSILSSFIGASGNSAADNSAMLDRLDGIYDRLGRLQIMMDTGALVGEIVDPVDDALAAKQMLAERGV